ncbi:MAG: restriction endonuclease [Schwartzia sp.]|nr:restriction endonuclease [Schwartzia sp. (in: firmicutes)]
MNRKHTSVFSAVSELLDQHGYTMFGFLQKYYNNNLDLLNLPDNAHKKFSGIYDKLCQEKNSARAKGNLLEELTHCLFTDGYGCMFDSHRQCRTSSNEIDILLLWSEQARLNGFACVFPFLGDSILCECKNYQKAVSVTHVGKFYSLMHVSMVNIGIMIAWNGISGRGNWDSAKGLVKKIVLRDNSYVIVIDKDDLNEIYLKKTNIFSLLYKKYESLKFETDYSKYIKPHPAEKRL